MLVVTSLCFDSWLGHFRVQLGNRYLLWFLKGQRHNEVEIHLDCLWVQAYLSCMLKRACAPASLESCWLIKKPCWGGLKGNWLADCLLGREVPSIVYIYSLFLQAGVLGGRVPLFSSHWARDLWSSLAVPKEAKIPRSNLVNPVNWTVKDQAFAKLADMTKNVFNFFIQVCWSRDSPWCWRVLTLKDWSGRPLI